MTSLTRVCGIAASVLILTICSAIVAESEPASQTGSATAPATITLLVPSDSPAGRTTTTVTFEVRPGVADQPTEFRVATDSDSRTPAVLAAAIGDTSLMTVSVDKQHPFEWNVVENTSSISGAARTATGCGPHPPSDMPGCSRGEDTQVTAQADAGAPSAVTEPVEPAVTGPGQNAMEPVERAVTSPLEAASAASVGESSPASPQAPTVAGGTVLTTQAPAQDGVTASTPLIYTVQPGDTLRAVAIRFFGDPNAFDRITRANANRVMPDGLTFVDPQVIRPGWELIIPQPTPAVADRDGACWYTVEPGDSLVGIAARLLGDEQRWPEVYALNQATQLGGTSSTVAAAPGLIQPGMQLLLPGRASNITARNAESWVRP